MINTKKSIISILITLAFFVLIPSLTAEAAGKFPKETSIANVPVEGLTSEEAKMRLQEEIVLWYEEEVLVGESDYETITIPRNIFKFDVDESIRNLEERTKRHWTSFFMKKKNVHLPLVVSIDKSIELPNYIDAEKMMNQASEVARNLGEDVLTIPYIEGAKMETEEIAKVEFTIPNLFRATLNHIVDQVDGTTIGAEEAFSFMESINLFESLADSHEETSFVASAIYRAALETNVEIIERHSQGTVPSYTEAGMEAEVNYQEGKNLLLFNPNAFPITINAEVEEDKFILTLEATPQEMSAEVFIRNKVEVDPKTITRYSSDLASGTSEIIQSGKNGLQMEVHRTVINELGEEETEMIARDYYAPQPKIIVVSSKQEAEVVEEEPTESEFLGGHITPEQFLSNDFLGIRGSRSTETTEGNDDESDEDEEVEKENFPSTTELLYSCILESIQKGAQASEEQEGEEETDTDETEESISYCDLFVLSMFGDLMDSESSKLEELEKIQEEEMLE